MSLRIIAQLLPLVLSSTTFAADSIYEMRYEPSDKPGELAFAVTYRLWVPDGLDQVRGVIVHQHGCGWPASRGGQTAVNDLHWQALARKWGCALFGSCYDQKDGDNCRLWCDPRNGSRARFLQALDDFALLSKHAELSRAPWCLWGHSGGGFWASLMQCSDPDRIVAIWLRSGTAFEAWEKGEVPKPELPEAVFAVPVVCNVGVKEKDDERFKKAWTGAEAMFRAYRAKGAPIAFVPDPQTGHECGDSRYLAIPYFDACLSLRLAGPGVADGALKPIPRRQGWLAEFGGDRAVPVASFAGKFEESLWLPTEGVARAWSEYVTKGIVGDTTPPPAPFALKAERKNDYTIDLSWDAHADLESGLSGFVIQRDGKAIARVPGKAPTQFTRPLFQKLSYHDTPERPLPAMTYRDSIVPEGVKPRYQVVAINGVGMESPPSAPSSAR